MMIDRLTPRYAPIDTPLGPGWVVYTARGVVLVANGRTERAFVAEAADELGAMPVRHDPPASFVRRVRASIERGDGSAVDWSLMPAFRRKVLQATARIPYGEVRSYGWIADAVGAPRAARAVGMALARNPIPFLIPCHRVVRGDGTLGNYGIGGTATKRMLLEREGYTGSATRTTRRSGRRAS